MGREGVREGFLKSEFEEIVQSTKYQVQSRDLNLFQNSASTGSWYIVLGTSYNF